MEDLRKQNKITKDGRSITTFTDHLPSIVIPNKIIKFGLYSLIAALIGVILYFPFEIGDIIGYWIYNFWDGLTHRFRF